MDKIAASVGIIRAKSGDIKNDELRKLGECSQRCSSRRYSSTKICSDNLTMEMGRQSAVKRINIRQEHADDSTANKAQNRRRITCPHCGKDGNIANIHRWHLDNCKAKP